MTRTYGQWYGRQNITIFGKNQTSQTTIEDIEFSPWNKTVLLGGTDGLQFSPDLQTNQTLGTFVPELSRNCYFNFVLNDNAMYENFDTYIYEVQPAFMQNMTANPVNKNYLINVDGTSNLTTILGTWSFAAKGHYYQLNSEAAEVAAPTIRGSDGQVITPSADEDETYMGVEQLSGATLMTKERTFKNLALYGDEFFTSFSSEYGQFFPLVYNKREFQWSQELVSSTFSKRSELQ